MIHLKPCQPLHEIEPLTVLLSQCFQKPEANVKDTLLWKYSQTNSFCAAALTDSQVYLAFYSNLQRDLAYQSENIPAGLCLDMCTHPQYRGLGLVTRTSQLVYPAVEKAGLALSYGFSNEQGIQVDRHAHQYGYHVVGQLYSYTLVPRGWSKVVFDPCISDFNELKHSLPGCHVAKPTQDISWRYQQKPRATYRSVALSGEPDKRVILLCQPCQCHIVDLIGTFPDIAAICDYLIKVVAACFNTWRRPVAISVLPNTRWQSILNQRNVLVLRQHPAPYYLTVKPHRTSIPFDPFDPDQWWVTSGDIL